MKTESSAVYVFTAKRDDGRQSHPYQKNRIYTVHGVIFKYMVGSFGMESIASYLKKLFPTYPKS
jgi:hypothetical protein